MWHRFLTMSRGILALFFRSLRIDARSIRLQLLWFLLAVVVYIALEVTRTLAGFIGAPGLHFFRVSMYVNALLITLLGISYFSSVISEEKEEGTLGLMLMAGINPLGILLGKSTSRLFQVSLLLAIQYPFTLLAITLGGLMPAQIYSAYASLLAYTVLLANVGLLCSIICRTSRNAAGLTTLWLICYIVLPLFAYGVSEFLTAQWQWTSSHFWHSFVLTGLDWMQRSNLYSELFSATETGHEFKWSVQILGNSLAGLACFVLSWFLFGVISHEPDQDTTSRGMVSRSTGKKWRWFAAGRCWNRALVWKDFFFITGGWAGLVIRSLLYIGLFGVCYAANRPWYVGSGYGMIWQDATIGFQSFAHPLLAIDIALCASRIFHEEIKAQTLSSLLMLPTSPARLIYSKMAGCAVGLAPGGIALLASVLFLPGGTKFADELLDSQEFYWWISNLILMIHLTALFSLYVRSGAFVLAMSVTIGSMIFTGFLAAISGFNPSGAFIFATFALVNVCIGCHIIFIYRLPDLGVK